MGFKEDFIEQFKKEGWDFLTDKQICKRMNASAFDRKIILDTLNVFLNEGKLISKDGKLVRPEKIGAMRGTIVGNPKGYAFFVPEGGGEDWFIPPNALNDAMNGDTVLIEKRGGRQGTEGAVVSILARKNTRLVCTFESRGKSGYCVPDEPRISHGIYISERGRAEARHGQKVVVQITRYPQNGRDCEGNIIEVLGNPFDKGTDILSIIRAFGLYEEFPERVLEAAKRVPDFVSDHELRGRRDFRKDKIITIDGADAKDLDDAVSIEKIGKNYRLSVHIADVAHYVSHNGILDKEARKRGTSVYFPDRVLPMLPRELSNGICSLTSGTDKLTLSLTIDIDKSGRVMSHELFEGVINTAHRMTYDEVTEILEGNKEVAEKYADVAEQIHCMNELAKILTKRREERGAIDFDLSECKIILDDLGRVSDIKPYPRKQSNRIIEEFMLVANETVAEHFSRELVPFVYRIHEVPSPEKIAALIELAGALGFQLQGKAEDIKPKAISGLLDAIKDTEYKIILNRVALRSMQKARYSEKNLGHFGLAAEYYSHFTSPIRRYPDLMIHRIIKLVLSEGRDAAQKFKSFVVEESASSSMRERSAEEAEREVDKLKKAEYMMGHIGEEFDGTISGVQDFGIFVELPNTVEGLIRAENLPKDSYIYDEKRICLRGAKHQFGIGEPQKIKVYKVDLELRKIEFVLADFEHISTNAQVGIKGNSKPKQNSQDRNAKKSAGTQSSAPKAYGGNKKSTKSGSFDRSHGGKAKPTAHNKKSGGSGKRPSNKSGKRK